MAVKVKYLIRVSVCKLCLWTNGKDFHLFWFWYSKFVLFLKFYSTSPALPFVFCLFCFFIGFNKTRNNRENLTLTYAACVSLSARLFKVAAQSLSERRNRQLWLLLLFFVTSFPTIQPFKNTQTGLRSVLVLHSCRLVLFTLMSDNLAQEDEDTEFYIWSVSAHEDTLCGS